MKKTSLTRETIIALLLCVAGLIASGILSSVALAGVPIKGSQVQGQSPAQKEQGNPPTVINAPDSDGKWSVAPSQTTGEGPEDTGNNTPSDAPTPQSGRPKPSAQVISAAAEEMEAPPPASPLVTLYDQLNIRGGNAYTTQEFEATQTAYNAQIADDFVVPAGEIWEVNEVDVRGQYAYGNGPAFSFNLFFYTTDITGTLPATPVMTQTRLLFIRQSDIFLVPLSQTVTLLPGKYWVSVQAYEYGVPNGQWFWYTRTTQSNSPAAFRNPGDGFETGCLDWTTRHPTCIDDANDETDHVFRIIGNRIIGTPTSTATGTPPTATPTNTLSPTSTPTNTPACPSLWNIVDSPNEGSGENRLVSVAAASAGDVWAVGHYIEPVTNHFRTLTKHWDGSQWTTVPSPNQGSGDNQLRGVTAVGGAVWAVGYYSQNGIFKTLTMRYSAGSWAIITSPNNGTGSNELNAVSGVASNDVWAVGRYRTATSQKDDLTLALRWNGTAWSVVSSPNRMDASSATIYNNLLAVHARASNDVWAVGEYMTYVNGDTGTRTGFYKRTLVLHWNASNWSLEQVPDYGFYNRLEGIAALAANDVWAVGSYVPSDCVVNCWRRTLVRHWNGSQWTIVPSPNSGTAQNVLLGITALSPTDIWAVGYSDEASFPYTRRTLIVHWDGTTWSVSPSANGSAQSYLYSVAAVGPNDLWAVGHSGYDVRSLAEHYEGVCATPTNTAIATNTLTPAATNTPGPSNTATNTLTPGPTPTDIPYCLTTSPNPGTLRNPLRAVAALSSNDVWAVGNYATDITPDRTFAARWNGFSWQTVPSNNGSPLDQNYLNGVAASTPLDGWAVGYYWEGGAGSGNEQHMVMRWNGQQWSTVLGLLNAGFGPNHLYGVASVAPNDVWAVGYYTIAAGQDIRHETLVMHWNGSAWSIVESPAVGYIFEVDNAGPNEVWAAGSPNLRYDGTSWSVAPGNAPSFARAVAAVAPNDVWLMQDLSAYHWDGATWTQHSFPVPPNTIGHTIESASAGGPNDVWAAGRYYDQVAGKVKTWLLHWDGSQWSIAPSPNPSPGGENYLYGVTSAGPSEAWVVGEQIPITRTQSLAAHIGVECTQDPTCGVGSDYVFTQTTGTIVSGTVDVGNHCNNCVTFVQFPFPLTFYGQQYDYGLVDSNGTIQFGAGSSVLTNTCLPTVWLYNTIMPFWDDLSTSTAGDGIFTSVTGIAPNRIYNVEWRARMFSGGATVNFEVRFYEGSDRIDIIYGTMNNNGSGATVGVQRDNGTKVTQFSCDTGVITAGLMLTAYTVPCGTPTPTSTRTVTPTQTPTNTPLSTNTPTNTHTPTRTNTPTSTSTNTSTNTPTRTSTSTNTPTGLPTSTATNTATNTPTATRTATSTSTPTRTNTSTITSTITSTNTPTRTPTITLTSTNTSTPTRTGTPTITPTGTIPTATHTPVPTHTHTATNTPTLTRTSTLTPTQTPTSTRTNTPTGTPSNTPTLTHTATATRTPTLTPSATPTSTPSATATYTHTSTSTSTPTTTPTETTVPTPTPTMCPVLFTDVNPGHWFYEYVEWMYCWGVVNGYNTNPPCLSGVPCFMPNNNTTRGQMAKMVTLAFGFPLDTTGGPHFSDVLPGSTFYAYTETLFNLAIISGYEDGTFRPAAQVTRAQVAKMAVNAAVLADPSNWTLEDPPSNTFEDVPVGSTFFKWVETAASHSVIEGYPCGTPPAGPCIPPGNKPYYLPSDHATRAQISKIVYLAATYP